MMLVKCIKTFYDRDRRETMEPSDPPFKVDVVRGHDLAIKGFVEIIKTPKQMTKPLGEDTNGDSGQDDTGN